MSKTETIIQTLNDMKKRGVTYSMNGSRTGTDGTADCSGAIYKGLINAGCPVLTYPFSTESEHQYLLNNGYMLLAHNQNWNAERGDIFIWGEKGSSNGAGGHTGIFEDPINILHCNYGYNGVTKNVYDDIYNYNLPNGVYVYRPINDTDKKAEQPKPAQVTGDGWITEKATFTAAIDLPFSKDIDPQSPEIATLKKGESIQYDAYKISSGYVWLRQPRTNGGYYYIASGKAANGKNVEPFGTYK